MECYKWRKRVVIPLADLIEPTRFWGAGRLLKCRRERRERRLEWLGHVCDKL